MRVALRYWIPTIIFLSSLCLHFSLISQGPVTVDCLNLTIKSQATIETHHLQYLFGSGYPLMVLLGSIFIFIGKCIGITDPVVAVNCIGVVWGSIAILAFYLLVQKICNNTLTSILASFILLLNPLFLDVSTYGINHAPTLCFLLLGLLSLLRFQNSGDMANLLLSSFYFGLMGATRLQDFILTFPAVGSLFILDLAPSSTKSDKHKAPYFFLFITITVLIIICFHLPYFISNHTSYDIQAKDFWKAGFNDNFRGLFSRFLIRGLSYLTKAFSIIGIVCFGTGLFYAAKSYKGLLPFIILWLIIPLSFYGNVMTSAPRFFNIMLPALIIPISILLTHMLKQKRILWGLIAAISFLLIILGPLLNTRQTFIRRHHHALIPDYYRWVGKSTPADATIISSDDDLFITYYSGRKTLSKPVSFGHLSPKELNDFKKKLDNIFKNQKPLYITNLAFTIYDHYHEFQKLLWQNYHLIKIGEKPLETWYETPFNPDLFMSILIKIEKKELDQKSSQNDTLLLN